MRQKRRPRPVAAPRWIGARLQRTLGGETGSDAIATCIGVRVSDMCWTADASRFEDDPAMSAPQICIEADAAGERKRSAFGVEFDLPPG